MHFTVDHEPFLRLVQHCQNAVDRKKINPLLTHICLSVEDAHLQLAATDTVLYMLGTVAADVEMSGKILVPAKTLFDILRELPAHSPVTCRLKEHVLHINCGRARFRLNAMSADAFPEAPPLHTEQRFTVAAPLWSKVIQMSVFCISTDVSRPFLTGASVIYDEGTKQLRLRTCNGFHMGLLAIPMEVTESKLTECMIPQRTMQEMRRLCENEAEPVALDMGMHQICLSLPDVTLFSKTVEENFPPFEHIIPSTMSSKLEMDKAELEQVLRRCLLVSDEPIYDVSFSITTDTVSLSTRNRNQESAVEPMDADVVLAEELTTPYIMALDGMFLRGILQVLPGERVQIHFRDNRSAIMIVDRDDQMARYMMMPLKEVI